MTRQKTERIGLCLFAAAFLFGCGDSIDDLKIKDNDASVADDDAESGTDDNAESNGDDDAESDGDDDTESDADNDAESDNDLKPDADDDAESDADDETESNDDDGETSDDDDDTTSDEDDDATSDEDDDETSDTDDDSNSDDSCSYTCVEQGECRTLGGEYIGEVGCPDETPICCDTGGADDDADTGEDTDADTEEDSEADTEEDSEPDTEEGSEPDTEEDSEPDTGANAGEACNAGTWTTTDVTQRGPFATVTENVTGAELYRPQEMLSGCLYPVITWGHGAGGTPSNYATVLDIMASHGFVVIASTAGNVQDGGTTANQFRNKMVEVAEWVVEQNSNSSSVLYQKIDPDKIGASGHSQGGYGASEAGQNSAIATSVSISGAVGSSNQKGPAFIICGGQDPYDGARCDDHPTDSYNGTSGVPVFFGKCLDADHGNWGFESMMSDRNNPHDITQATIAWFRYHLMGDEEYRSWFYGADCHLCNHSNWSVQRKGMD